MEKHKLDNVESLKQLMTAKVTVVDFSASWCGPCKLFHPQLENLAQQYKAKSVKFLEVDVDESPDLAEKFDITAMPTVIVFKGNNPTPVSRTVGSNLQKVEEAVAKVLEEADE